MNAVAFVIEGHAEANAYPLLVQKIAICLSLDLAPVWKTYRVPKGKMTSDADALCNATRLQTRRASHQCGADGRGLVLVTLDADKDCPAELGLTLQTRLSEKCGDLPARVVIANVNFETWFVASAASLRDAGRITFDGDPPDDPEGDRLRDG